MSKVTWFIIAFIVFIGGIVVYNKVLYPKENPTAGLKAGATKALTVNGFVAEPKDLENRIIASGTLLAFENVDLHPEMSGRITTLNLNEGSTVTKGTLLVKLFDGDLQAQLEKLQAQKETAVKTEQRLKQLLAINGVGQQDYDNALTQVKSIQADIDYTNAQISKTEIRAPFNGEVGLRNVSVGAFVSPTTVIATLQQIDPLKVDFTIPEKYSSVVHKGDPIKFTVDGYSTPFTGKIYAIEPLIDETSRTIKIRGITQNTNAKLFPGAYAKIDLGLKNTENALMIPTQCIIPEARTNKVAVFKNGKAEFHEVETGIRNATYIQITSGITAGDTVVATAIMYVKSGMDLKVEKIIQ